MELSESKNILITGFAPFGGAEFNQSWEGVDAIDKNEIEKRLGVQLRQEIIEVKYKHVAERVPKLWQKHRPCLTIHVGISDPEIQSFVLENQAVKEGYRPRPNSETPEPFKSTCPDQITTSIDVDTICDKFNSDLQAEGLEAKVSSHAGRYVCEYTYYTSLCQSPNTLLVHVPKTMYNAIQIARGLEYILELAYHQLESTKSSHGLSITWREATELLLAKKPSVSRQQSRSSATQQLCLVPQSKTDDGQKETIEDGRQKETVGCKCCVIQ